MDKKTASLLGAVAGLALSATPALASPPEVLNAANYADLLTPVPNASATLRADNQARLEQVQGYYEGRPGYGYGPPPPPPPRHYAGYNHHHHAYYRNHHHHHHHHGTFIGVPGVGGVVVGH